MKCRWRNFEETKNKLVRYHGVRGMSSNFKKIYWIKAAVGSLIELQPTKLETKSFI